MEEHEAKITSTVVAVVQERNKMLSRLDVLQSENIKLKRELKLIKSECNHLQTKLKKSQELASACYRDVEEIIIMIDGNEAKLEGRDDVQS